MNKILENVNKVFLFQTRMASTRTHTHTHTHTCAHTCARPHVSEHRHIADNMQYLSYRTTFPSFSPLKLTRMTSKGLILPLRDSI